MAKLPRQLTKRSRILGLPVGRRRTDWRKVTMVGLGVGSTIAGGARARQSGQNITNKVRETLGEPLSKGKEALERASTLGDEAGAIGEAMSEASTPLGKVMTAVKGVGGGDGGDGQEGGRNLTKLRLIIKEAIDVGVPRQVAYNQWTQLEDLPSILKGVQSVSQEEDDVARWTAKIGPSRRQWRAEIMEQTPDERIVWESTDGTENRGVITFHRLDNNLTRVQVEMEYFPNGAVEKVGNVFLAARRRVRKDLRLFKHYMELAGAETGAWRGEISKDGEEDGGEPEEAAEQEAPQEAEQDTGRAESREGDDREDDQAVQAQQSHA